MKESLENKIYESPTMVDVPLTAEQAFEILWEGNSVRISNPSDNESDIALTDIIFLTDIIRRDLEKQSKYKSEKQVYEYLRGYEIWK